MIGKKFGVIYTCNCGWLDRAHSYPFSSRPGVGVDSLIKTIAYERGMQDTIRNQSGFVVAYGQDAVKSLGPIKVYPGVRNHYVVRKGLSNAQKLQVALGIFVDVLLQFEGAQNTWLARTLIDDGGEVFEGRPLEVMGSHAGEGLSQGPLNDPDWGAVGIAMQGDHHYADDWFFHSKAPVAQLNSLTRLVHALTRAYGIHKLLMHREVKRAGPPTVCPGDHLVPKIKALRTELKLGV
jgi:hypothetical protein